MTAEELVFDCAVNLEEKGLSELKALGVSSRDVSFGVYLVLTPHKGVSDLARRFNVLPETARNHTNRFCKAIAAEIRGALYETA